MQINYRGHAPDRRIASCRMNLPAYDAAGEIDGKSFSHRAAPPVGFFPIRQRISALYTFKPLALAFLQCRIHVRFAE
jgi:hypothetical protein